MGEFILLFGKPGAGKGTQGEMLEKELGLPRISTGDAFRALDKNTELGKRVYEIMNSGGLVEDELVKKVLKEELTKPKYANGALLDAAVRTPPQIEMLDEISKELGHELTHVASIEPSDEEIVRRLSGRWTCKACKKIHNYPAPSQAVKCEECGGELYQREDDKPDGIKARLKTYEDKTAPVRGMYEERGLLRAIVVPDGAKKETVFQLILKAIGRS